MDGEHARRVVPLLADVFTDALKLTAANALGVVQLRILRSESTNNANSSYC